MIVVVDDERTFNAPVDLYLRDCTQALSFFARRFESPIVEPCDLYLDHDLGTGGDAIDVVRFLVACERFTTVHGILEIRKVYIHSQNPVGVANMYRELAGYYNVQCIPLPALWHEPWPT